MGEGLEVIGAGFGRTGTLSLKAALETLGFGPCYHMYELLGHVEHGPSWLAVEGGDAGALRVPLAGYRATVDWPGCVFWRELCDLYPEAKVVLSVRPSERWYASFRETVGALLARGMPAGDEVPAAFEPIMQVSDLIVRDRSFGPDFDVDDVDRVIASYEAHNRAVQDSVAPDRLLVFDVADGWGPLCSFLGVPVPDGEFPNVNDREQFKQLFALEDPPTEITEQVVADAQARFREASGTP